MLSQNRPRFSAERAVDVARQLYGLEVEVLEELPSERDQNFHLRDREGTELVLKFSNTEEPRSVLELQNEALRHVAHRDPEIVIPQLRELSEGGTMTEVEGDDGPSYPCRLFNYLPGRPLALSKPHPESLLRSVGRFMGRLDRALEGLRHDSKRRKLMWRAESAPEILHDGIALVENEGRRELLSYYLSLYETEVAPELSSLPSGVIHNDGNDHNVLVLGRRGRGYPGFRRYHRVRHRLRASQCGGLLHARQEGPVPCGFRRRGRISRGASSERARALTRLSSRRDTPGDERLDLGAAVSRRAREGLPAREREPRLESPGSTPRGVPPVSRTIVFATPAA